MDGKQQLIGAAGFGLIAANWFLKKPGGSGGQGAPLTSLLFNSGASKTQVGSASTALKEVLAELMVVVVLVVISGVSDTAGNFALVLVLGLWLVWAMTRYGNLGAKAA